MVHGVLKQCHQIATSIAAQALLCLHVAACSLAQEARLKEAAAGVTCKGLGRGPCPRF